MIPDFVRQSSAAPIDYDRLIRMLDAEMLESVGQPIPFDELEGDAMNEAAESTATRRRLLPIASVALALSAISVLILARFSGM